MKDSKAFLVLITEFIIKATSIRGPRIARRLGDIIEAPKTYWFSSVQRGNWQFITSMCHS